MNALVVGHAEPAAALTSALAEQGIEAELHAVPRQDPERAIPELAAALVALESRLGNERPGLVVAVGVGDAPLALALSAAKLGIPLVAWVESQAPDAPGLEEAERRILTVLADLDAGVVGDGVEAIEAAKRIAAWADLELGA